MYEVFSTSQRSSLPVQRLEGPGTGHVGAEKPVWYAAAERLPSGLPWGWIIGIATVAGVALIGYHVWKPILAGSRKD